MNTKTKKIDYGMFSTLNQDILNIQGVQIRTKDGGKIDFIPQAPYDAESGFVFSVIRKNKDFNIKYYKKNISEKQAHKIFFNTAKVDFGYEDYKKERPLYSESEKIQNDIERQKLYEELNKELENKKKQIENN